MPVMLSPHTRVTMPLFLPFFLLRTRLSLPAFRSSPRPPRPPRNTWGGMGRCEMPGRDRREGPTFLGPWAVKPFTCIWVSWFFDFWGIFHTGFSLYDPSIFFLCTCVYVNFPFSNYHFHWDERDGEEGGGGVKGGVWREIGGWQRELFSFPSFSVFFSDREGSLSLFFRLGFLLFSFFFSSSCLSSRLGWGKREVGREREPGSGWMGFQQDFGRFLK